MLSLQAFIYASLFVSLALGQPLVNSFRTVALPASGITPRALAHVSNERVHDSSSLRKRHISHDNERHLTRRGLARRARLTGSNDEGADVSLQAKLGNPDWKRSLVIRTTSEPVGYRTHSARNLGFTSSGDLVGGQEHSVHGHAGGGLLSGLPVIGGGGIPVVGDVLHGLPIVGGHASGQGGLLAGLPVVGGLQGLPVVGGLLHSSGGGGGLLQGLPLVGGGSGELSLGGHSGVSISGGVKAS